LTERGRAKPEGLLQLVHVGDTHYHHTRPPFGLSADLEGLTGPRLLVNSACELDEEHNIYLLTPLHQYL
jgi:hypothetical protein